MKNLPLAPYLPEKMSPEVEAAFLFLREICYLLGYTHPRAALAAIVSHAFQTIEHYRLDNIAEMIPFVMDVTELYSFIDRLYESRKTIETMERILRTGGLNALEPDADLNPLDRNFDGSIEKMQRMLEATAEASGVRGVTSLRTVATLHIPMINIYDTSHIDSLFVRIISSATPNVLYNIALLVASEGL